MADTEQITPRSNRPQILISDDDPTTLRMVKAILEKNGFDVCGEATNGLDTLVQAAQKRPDVILLDIRMPLGNGLTILPVIREIDENICVIMLTADDTSDSVHTAISLGAKGYFVKSSMDFERLLAVVRKLTAIPETSEPIPSKPITELSEESTSQKPDRKERRRPYKLVAEQLSGLPVKYITGGLHLSEVGGVYMYHPLTASREQGEIASTFREIKKHPEYIVSFFRHLKGFKEIPSLLFDQGINGDIFEIYLKALPTLGKKEEVIFALRQYEAGTHNDLPLGLRPDGSPAMALNRTGDGQPAPAIAEHLFDPLMQSSELGDYTCSFNGLSLETCLFLTTFNMQEIIRAVDKSLITQKAVTNHGDEVRAYAEWQGIPKAVLYGNLDLLRVPKSTFSNLVVTNSLSDRELAGDERVALHYWMDKHTYRSHLQHYQNRWSLPVVPLMCIKGEATVSLLHAWGQRERLAIKRSTAIEDIFDNHGYSPISSMDLIQEFPSLQLSDLLRPLLFNTFLARMPALRIEESLESPLDVHNRKRHISMLMKGDGLQWLEKDKPFLMREVSQELLRKGINESNPAYAKEVVQSISRRCKTTASLPLEKPGQQNIEPEEFERRTRVKDARLRQQRYKEKYEK